MTHWVIAPLLLPLLGGLVQLFVRNRGWAAQRYVGAGLLAALVAFSVQIFRLALTGETFVYSLGDWPAPYGIVLVLDRLSAMMILLTSLLACAAFAYAWARRTDELGPHFHPLFQLQLFGLIGAFLTGDVFNLFVFFEVLLLASYGLILHGSGKARTGAGLHYVVVNLVGSTLYLFAVGALYGGLGTLNIADMALKVSTVPAERTGLIAAAGLLLFVVFGIKAAMFPLYLWLPRAYANTSAPVAALFAIMTKVGVYAIIRVHGTVFGEQAGTLASLHKPWLLGAGLITILLASLGVMAAKHLRRQVAYLVLASVATLLIAVGLDDTTALAAGLYYLIHSTFLAAGFFLLADLISDARGDAGDSLKQVRPLAGYRPLGIAFFGFAVAMAGLPPLSGFFGKLMILKAGLNHPQGWLVLAALLTASFLILASLVRTGSFLFFRALDPREEGASGRESGQPPRGAALLIVYALLAAAPLMVVFAGPLAGYTETTAEQVNQAPQYLQKVLGSREPQVEGTTP